MKTASTGNDSKTSSIHIRGATSAPVVEFDDGGRLRHGEPSKAPIAPRHRAGSGPDIGGVAADPPHDRRVGSPHGTGRSVSLAAAIIAGVRSRLRPDGRLFWPLWSMTAPTSVSAGRRATRSGTSTKARAIFGRSYAAEPRVLIEQLAEDEAIAAADTLLLTVPNQLSVEHTLTPWRAS